MFKQIFIIFSFILFASTSFADVRTLDGNAPLIPTPTTYTVITFPDNYQSEPLSQEWIEAFSNSQTLLYLRNITECKTYISSDPDWAQRLDAWVVQLPAIMIIENGNLLYKRSGQKPEIIEKEIEQLLPRIRPCPPNQPCPVDPYQPNINPQYPQQPQPYLPNNNRPNQPLQPTTPMFPTPVPLPETPLPTPIVPDNDELDEYIKVNDSKLKDLEGRLATLEGGLKSQDAEQKNLVKEVNTLKSTVPGMVTILQNELNKVKETVITPGKLNEVLQPKLDEFNSKFDEQSVAVTDALGGIKNYAEKVTDKISNLEKHTDKLETRVETTNNTVFKEILSDKTISAENTSEDRKFGLWQTLINAGVPSMVVGWIGWLISRRLGGTAPPPPFPPKMK